MKKALSIILSVCMLLSFVSVAFATKAVTEPATAYAEYDRGKVSGKDADYIDTLTYDQMAGVILDWVDRKIAEVTADFTSFNQEVNVEAAGQEISLQIPVTLEIGSLDDIIAYKDYLSVLGGDFANLDTTALDGLTRANGDIKFIFAILDFMGDNAEYFGKVFSWTEGDTFDFGNVGTYIESLEEDNEIRTFYEDYLIGNDIQEKFVSEIAKEMGYTIGEGETFDDVINNGILNKVADFCKTNNILSDDAIATLKADYNLRTTDVYTLIKNFVGLVQSDNQVKLNTYFRYYLDTPVRTALMATFGRTAVVDENEDHSADAEFNAAYTDLKLLEEISGGTVYFRAADGDYFVFTLENGAIDTANALTWTDSLLNFEPPTVEIWDAAQKVGGAYTPTSTEVSDYAPTVYTDDYSEYVDTTDLVAAAGEFGVTVSTDAIPEAITNIIAAGNGVAMQDKFVMKIDGEVLGTDLSKTPIEISFADVETAVNEQLAAQLPTIQAQVDTAVNTAVSTASSIVSGVTGSVKINSIKVSLSYKGYSDEDTFVCEVTAVPDIDLDYEGNVWNYATMVGLTKDKIKETYIQPAIDAAITNPVATIVVDNLNGSKEGLEDVTDLLNFVNTDFAVDTDILDFADNYDDYDGVIGQSNRVLCDMLKMMLSADGYESLDLTEGKNVNLTDNLQKLCNKVDGLLTLAKEYMNEEDFASFAKSMKVSSAFASVHGFNAGMIYNMDFSSVENLYVCAIRLGCDFLVKDDSGVAYDIHLIVEDLDTLDAMAIGVANYALNKVIADLNEEDEGIFASFKYNYTLLTSDELANINETANTIEDVDYAKNYIMNDLTNIAYYAASWGVDNVVNKLINDAIDEFNTEAETDIPHVDFELDVADGCKTWSVTLGALADRVLGLVEGIYIPEAADNATVFGKIGTLLNALPLESILSGTTDADVIAGYVFTDALAGDFEGILSLFEVKEDAIAGDVPVTKALINASDYIVDNFFPGTVASENYTASTTVQETFTGSVSDAGIAARNMKSIDSRKANLVPAALDLIRESNTLLPYFAHCDHTNTEEVAGKASTCSTKGYSTGYKCKDCGYVVPGEELPLDANNHENVVDVKEVAATCTTKGSTAGTKCTACGKTVSGCTEVAALGHDYTVAQTTVAPTCTEKGYTTYKCSRCSATETRDYADATGHTDADDDGWCDSCGEELRTHEEEKESFFTKIINFFKKIVDFFKNLFK